MVENEKRLDRREDRAHPGHEHTTGAGETPARRILRSGRRDVPGQAIPATDHPHDSGWGPAMTGVDETGEATEEDATPARPSADPAE